MVLCDMFAYLIPELHTSLDVSMARQPTITPYVSFLWKHCSCHTACSNSTQSYQDIPHDWLICSAASTCMSLMYVYMHANDVYRGSTGTLTFLSIYTRFLLLSTAYHCHQKCVFLKREEGCQLEIVLSQCKVGSPAIYTTLK